MVECNVVHLQITSINLLADRITLALKVTLNPSSTHLLSLL